MNAEERQRQMDFLLQQQAVHDHDIARIRRILISAIRIGRRDRADFREKLNALINAQIRSEEETSKFRAENIKFQAETSKFQAETSKFQAETRQALSVLTKSVSETIDRVDELEDSHGNGRPTN